MTRFGRGFLDIVTACVEHRGSSFRLGLSARSSPFQECVDGDFSGLSTTGQIRGDGDPSHIAGVATALRYVRMTGTIIDIELATSSLLHRACYIELAMRHNERYGHAKPGPATGGQGHGCRIPGRCIRARGPQCGQHSCGTTHAHGRGTPPSEFRNPMKGRAAPWRVG